MASVEYHWAPLDACLVAHSSPLRMSTRSVRPSFVTEKQHSAVAIIIADVCCTSPHHLKSPSFGKKRRLKYSFRCSYQHEPPRKCLCAKKRPQRNVDAELRCPLVVAPLYGAQCPVVMECYGRLPRHGRCPHCHGCHAAVDLWMVPDQPCFKSLSCTVHHTPSGASTQGTFGSKSRRFTLRSRIGLS